VRQITLGSACCARLLQETMVIDYYSTSWRDVARLDLIVEVTERQASFLSAAALFCRDCCTAAAALLPCTRFAPCQPPAVPAPSAIVQIESQCCPLLQHHVHLNHLNRS